MKNWIDEEVYQIKMVGSKIQYKRPEKNKAQRGSLSNCFDAIKVLYLLCAIMFSVLCMYRTHLLITDLLSINLGLTINELEKFQESVSYVFSFGIIGSVFLLVVMIIILVGYFIKFQTRARAIGELVFMYVLSILVLSIALVPIITLQDFAYKIEEISQAMESYHKSHQANEYEKENNLYFMGELNDIFEMRNLYKEDNSTMLQESVIDFIEKFYGEPTLIVGKSVKGAIEPSSYRPAINLLGQKINLGLLRPIMPISRFLKRPTRVNLFTDAIYFSSMTLSTVGYGDISPINPSLRMMISIYAIISQLMLIFGVAIAAGFREK